MVAGMMLKTLLVATLLLPLLPTHAQESDGQHDFDFEIGTWKTHVRRLVKPLSGSTTWVEMNGTTVVRPIANGRGNIVELVADGFVGISVRLYNPKAKQWSLNFANLADGVLTTPTIGQFNGDRGEFYAQERLGERAILVRFVIIKTNADSCRFEQSFSDDGGKTWELNWVAVDTRVKDAAGTSD
ncbi:MAG TPA: hypothetical protein VF787_24260 [Thermoanaerobaculia bacterium]